MTVSEPQSFVGRVLLGQYRVERLIGAGSFAWVFGAVASNGYPVAVKIPKDARSDDGRTLFNREIKVMSKLPRSAFCVGYVGDGLLNDGRPFLMMEYVDGVTLKDTLKFRPVWEEREACELMLQLCEAFAGLHHLGVAHRDLKPENVMLTRDWRVKLMDFGLIKDAQGLLKLMENEDILHGKDFAENLDRAMLAGTPEYMAPEQFSDPLEEDEAKEQTDTWTDVYALGMVFFEILTGRKLFPITGPTKTQAEFSRTLYDYMKQRTGFTDEQLRRPDHVSPALWSIIARALRQRPRQRQVNAAELGRDIQIYLTTGEGVEGSDLFESTIDMKGFLAQNPSMRLPMPSAPTAIAAAPVPAAPAPTAAPSPQHGDAHSVRAEFDRIRAMADEELDEITRTLVDADSIEAARQLAAATRAQNAAQQHATSGAHQAAMTSGAHGGAMTSGAHAAPMYSNPQPMVHSVASPPAAAPGGAPISAPNAVTDVHFAAKPQAPATPSRAPIWIIVVLFVVGVGAAVAARLLHLF